MWSRSEVGLQPSCCPSRKPRISSWANADEYGRGLGAIRSQAARSTAPTHGAVDSWISHGYRHLAMTKVLISMPDELLARIDLEAARRQTSRSGFLQEAARTELGWASAETIDAALARGRVALAGIGSFDAAELIRETRQARDAADRRR